MINHYSSASQMLAALRARTVSAAELLQMQTARIEQIDGEINAVVIRDFERAGQVAKAADASLNSEHAGALLGLPMTIKESINVAGLATCCGIEQARGFVSPVDSPTATRLKAAGAVIIGKTNIPIELADWQSANPVYGRTVNPFDHSRSAGGSSGGSAAALAAGMTPLEVGSDIGGSIRVPAAFCGVFGHRPSESALAKSGQFPVPPTPIPASVLAVQGPMARTATDLRLGLSVLAGADIGEDIAWQLHLPQPRHSKLAQFRVAALDVPSWVPVDPSIRQAQDSLLDILREQGCTVNMVSPTGFGDWRTHAQLYLKLLGAMLGARTPDAVRRERIAVLSEVGDDASRLFCEGMGASVAQLFQWLGEREQVRAAWRQFFTEHDVFITPAVMRNAYPHLALEGSPLIAARNEKITVNGQSVPYIDQVFFPGVCTLAGQPATAFPMGRDQDGLPIGLQAVGPYLEDYTPIHFVELLEQTEVVGFSPPPQYA